MSEFEKNLEKYSKNNTIPSNIISLFGSDLNDNQKGGSVGLAILSATVLAGLGYRAFCRRTGLGVLVGAVVVLVCILVACSKRLVTWGIHRRTVPAWVAFAVGHPLAKPYASSLVAEEEFNRDPSSSTLGFERVEPLLTPKVDRLPIPEAVIDEIGILEKYENKRALGDPLQVAGKKVGYYFLNILGQPTEHSRKVPEIMKLLDDIGHVMDAKVVGASLGIMYPDTWIKFHEGFWGYAEYVSRVLFVLDGPSDGCAIHVAGSAPITERPGMLTVFSDTEMHEAWNVSSKRRVMLIVDVTQTDKIDLESGIKSVDLLIQNLVHKYRTGRKNTFADTRFAKSNAVMDSLVALLHHKPFTYTNFEKVPSQDVKND